MIRKILKVLIGALLLVASAAHVLPQSVGEHKQVGEASLEASASLPISAGQQQHAGLVLLDKAAQPAPYKSHSRFIDPINGLTSQELVRYALSHNGELAAAQQMIAEARGRLHQAELKPNPMIESNYQRAVTSPDRNVMMGAELPLELGGRRKARIGVAQREVELREAEVADFKRRLAADVRMKYAEVVQAARNLKLTEDLLNFTRDSYRIVQARVERGKSAPLEQKIIFVEMSRVDAMRINLEGRAEVALLELKKSIGMRPDEPLKLRGEFDTHHPPPQSEALLSALASRPDLKAAQAAENLALAQIEQARTEGRIDASIFANYERMNFGYSLRGFNDAGALVPITSVFHYFGIGLKLMLPIRNKNQGNIEAALAQLEAARKRREFTQLIVRNEVAAAYARFERAQAALAIYRDNVREQALRNLDVIRQTYVLGQRSLLDYINEQRRFIEVETAYTEVLKEYFNSLVEIERAIGMPIPPEN
jgi:cobalt-zinc-cadmium efflux system outer membrane protein